MFAELKRHRIAYSTLLAGVSLFGLAIFAVWPNRELQRVLILALGLFYCVWGIVTHVHSKTVTRRVVLEYAGVSLLATGLLALMTF